MKKFKIDFKTCLVFIVSVLVFHLIGSSIFPVDEETNVLLAPGWYPIACMLFALGMSLLFYNRKTLFKGKKRADSTSDDLTEDIKEWKKERGRINAPPYTENLLFTEKQIGLEQLNAEHEPKPKNPMARIDGMEGHDFEYWCADLLKKLEYRNVEVTPGSGDQGADILAEKEGVRYAIQCKCYSRDLGNEPIQEVEAGRIYYGCHVGAVMTNRHFTKGAKALAEKTGTLLWDRDFLIQAIGVQ